MFPDPTDSGVAYAEMRTRLTGLLREDPAGSGPMIVPGCPDWRVKDVVAHLTGACLDILEGNLDGVATDPWTAAQVARFADADLSDVLATWDEAGPQVEVLAPAFPAKEACQLVFDATTHEHDIRGALGRPGARSSNSMVVGFAFVLDALDGYVRHKGLPAIEIRTEAGTFTAGDGAADVVLSATLFDAFRSLGGRRSIDQIRALDWSADADPYLGVFKTMVLRPPAEALVE